MNFNVKDTNSPQSKYNYYSDGAIYAGGNQKLQQGSTINVNGNVNLQGNGIYANGNGSTVNINGGGIINVDKDKPNGAFAIGVQSGTVNLNMDNNNRTALNNDLVINGNVSLTSGSMVNTENHKESIVNIGLATNKSSLNGVIANGFSEKDTTNGFTGSANLYLSNGATWNNELYGELPSNWGGGNFTGSKLDKFVGGDSEKTAGVIHQKIAMISLLVIIVVIVWLFTNIQEMVQKLKIIQQEILLSKMHRKIQVSLFLQIVMVLLCLIEIW